MLISRRDVCIQGGLSIITTGLAALTSGCGADASLEQEPTSAERNAGAAAPGAAAPGAAAPYADESGPLLSRLTATDFAALNGSMFLFQTGNETASTQLVDVAVPQRTAGASKAPAAECYQLVFEVPEGVRFEQATYPVSHPKLGSLDLFVVPEARRRDVERSAGSPKPSLLVATIYRG